MNRCLQGAQVPEWMAKGKTTWIQNDPNKGTVPNNYRPITYLQMMWKKLTAQVKEELYYSIISRRKFPGEQKGCCKGFRSTAELIYIEQHVLKVIKTRREKTRSDMD